MRRLAIPDIHGCATTFEALLEKINLQTSDKLYLLGDYIDRGKNSSGVLDKIINLQQTHQVFPILGNHEYDMLRAEKEYDSATFYMYAKRMAKSADLLDDNRKIQEKYKNFFYSLPFYIELEDFILVHGGIDFSQADIFANKSALLTQRDFDRNVPKNFPKTIIHGHNPKNFEVIQKKIENRSKVISLDNGCVYNKPHKYYDHTKKGKLLCFNMDTYELIWQKNIE